MRGDLLSMEHTTRIPSCPKTRMSLGYQQEVELLWMSAAEPLFNLFATDGADQHLVHCLGIIAKRLAVSRNTSTLDVDD